MSISDWSSYEGAVDDIEWSKDDLLERIEAEDNVSETTPKGLNFMHIAAEKGWQDVIEKLNEVDPALKDAQDDFGTTPSMIAAFNKKTGIVRFLLDQGADVSLVNDEGFNLLHYAAYYGVMQGNHFFIHFLTYSLHDTNF